MKKILLLSAVLLGAVTASQAGVHFGIDIPIPAPPAIVYVEPPVEAYVEPPEVCAPPVVVAPPVFDFRFGYRHPYYRNYPYRDRDDWRWRHEYREHEYHERGYGGYHHRW